MDVGVAYGIMVFYGLILIICAAIGNHFDKKDGFSNGFVFGSLLNLVLWFTAGRKIAKA